MIRDGKDIGMEELAGMEPTLHEALVKLTAYCTEEMKTFVPFWDAKCVDVSFDFNGHHYTIWPSTVGCSSAFMDSKFPRPAGKILEEAGCTNVEEDGLID